MRLVYRTGIAALIQFILMSIFGFANGVNSVVTTCHNEKGDCVSNLIVSIIFLLLLAVWFGAVWVLASVAQEQRSKRLARLLMAAEAGILIIALFNAKHHTDKLSLLTSATDIVLAVWVIVLAYRLSTSNGGRIVRRRLRNS